MNSELLWVLKKWDHSHFRRVSCVVRLNFFDLTVAVLVHTESVVCCLLARIALILLFCYFLLNMLVIDFTFLLICCFVLFVDNLNHYEAKSCLQVWVSDHLNKTIIDLGKGHLLVVVAWVVFLNEVFDELFGLFASIFLQTKILEVEHLSLLLFG